MPKIVCRLLLVEDNEEEIGRFERAVRDENKRDDVPLQFELVIVQNAQDARDTIRDQRIDCAVVDLRIPYSADDANDAANGNELLKKSLDEQAIPHVVHSGHAGELDGAVESYNIKIVDKEGGEYPEIFGWLYDKKPLIETMAKVARDLGRETAILFHKSILPHWKESQKFVEGDDELQKIILRQVASHLAEQLSLPLTGVPKHHLHEAYFRPPLREERLHTGDLIELQDGTYVVVTPQCNMVNDYPEHLLMAKCEEMDDQLEEIRSLFEGGNDKQKRAMRRLSSFAGQNIDISNHYLPPCGDKGPWMVDFKWVKSFPNSEVDSLKAARLASMSPQFIANLVQRFSAYMGRLGQPDLNVDEMKDHLLSEA